MILTTHMWIQIKGLFCVGSKKKILILRRKIGGAYIVDHELSKEVPSGEAPGTAMAWSRSVGFLNQKWMVCLWKRAQKLMSLKSCTRWYQYLFADSIRSWVSRNPSCDAAGFPFKVPGQILWINDSFFCVTCLFCRIVVESFTTSQPSSNQVHHPV